MWEPFQRLRLYLCSYFFWFLAPLLLLLHCEMLRRASSVWVVWGIICWDTLLALVKPLWQSGFSHFHFWDCADIKPCNRQTLAVGSDVLYAARSPRERRKSYVGGSHHPVYTCMLCVCVAEALTPVRPVRTALNSHDGSHREAERHGSAYRHVCLQEPQQNHLVLPEDPDACLTATIKLTQLQVL